MAEHPLAAHLATAVRQREELTAEAAGLKASADALGPLDTELKANLWFDAMERWTRATRDAAHNAVHERALRAQIAEQR